MTVQELIDKLLEVENKNIPIEMSYVNVTWSGGCDTCGWGAVANKDEVTSSDVSVYDLESRFVIETKRETSQY